MTDRDDLSETITAADTVPVILTFINTDGEIVQSQRGRNLPTPRVGDTVSFGELTYSGPAINMDSAEYDRDEPLYTVENVEFTYGNIRHSDEEGQSETNADPTYDTFVQVSIYLSKKGKRSSSRKQKNSIRT